MNKTMIHVMVGIPASGKSTIVKNMIEKFEQMSNINYVVICPDDIRDELGTIDMNNPEEYRNREAKTWAIAKGRLKGAIDLGINHIIFDATSLKRKDRKLFFKDEFRNVNPNVSVTAWVLDIPYEVAIFQNRKRQSEGGRFVPEDVIKRMSGEFTMPTLDEGFVRVNIISPEN